MIESLTYVADKERRGKQTPEYGKLVLVRGNERLEVDVILSELEIANGSDMMASDELSFEFVAADKPEVHEVYPSGGQPASAPQVQGETVTDFGTLDLPGPASDKRRSGDLYAGAVKIASEEMRERMKARAAEAITGMIARPYRRRLAEKVLSDLCRADRVHSGSTKYIDDHARNIARMAVRIADEFEAALNSGDEDPSEDESKPSPPQSNND